MTQPIISVRSLLAAARKRLGPGPASALEADTLLTHVLGVDRSWLFANSERPVPSAEARSFRNLIERRAGGEPIAYLTGSREFWSLPLQVTPDVLIPRPETELLVQTALDFIPPDAAWRIADLGTGSGAVAIAIALERPMCDVHATEFSAAALGVAALNVAALAPGRVALHRGSWLEPLEGRFRVIVSNPPYVAGGDPHLAAGDCRFEPRAALTPGTDGMAAIRRIAKESLPRLEPGGLLAFEHGFDQGEDSRSLLQSLGYWKVCTRDDLEGRERVTSGRCPDVA
ncbi:MAG TPA: peptide chain release factor N(5)-glutamine methyltransferase [Xanthomonadales bacterium]|nr:peptide chain release factor N(5)-glutamine methyltransferase [Xanthomonadales bacterium]